MAESPPPPVQEDKKRVRFSCSQGLNEVVVNDLPLISSRWLLLVEGYDFNL